MIAEHGGLTYYMAKHKQQHANADMQRVAELDEFKLSIIELR